MIHLSFCGLILFFDSQSREIKMNYESHFLWNNKNHKTRQIKLYYFTNVSSQGLWIIVNCLFVVVQVQVQGVPAEYQ